MANRERHRRFGNVRRRESGRYQIRYPGPDGRMRTGPETYARKADADRARHHGLVALNTFGRSPLSATRKTLPDRSRLASNRSHRNFPPTRRPLRSETFCPLI